MDRDHERLVEEAFGIIKERYKDGFHHVGAALQTTSGRVYRAVHLEANVGRIAVCAEAVAIGMAAADGDTDIQVIVAVDRYGDVLSPCGMCRELISDYAPGALVIVPSEDGDGVQAVPVSALLPKRYRRRNEYPVQLDEMD